MSTSPIDEISYDAGSARGYRRAEALQREFDGAAASLLANDPWVTENGDRPPGPPELRCDLALEGGGVKGIALVGAVLVLDEAGYRIQRVAGTSAGAIAAGLIAGIVQRGRPMSDLRTYLENVSFESFMTEGPVRHLLDHLGRPGEILGDIAVLAERDGLYSGDYLYTWLSPILADLGVRTFADLRITEDEDPGMSLPVERQYRLVVHTSDITRRDLVRLPWDLSFYGLEPETMRVDQAIRASMSIPFFFEPFRLRAAAADPKVPVPGGTTTRLHYDAATVIWVDGGMLRNFPINAFDRLDGKPPRWPTIGIKLSALQRTFGVERPCSNAIEMAITCIETMMGEWDRYEIEETTAARTIFIDNLGVSTTDFHLDQETRNRLFCSGVAAATQFVIEMGRLGHVPDDPAECAELVSLRKQLNGSPPPR